MDTNEQNKLVAAHRLLEIVWDEASRPSIRWLRYQVTAKAIPHIKIGGSLFFDPTEVRAALARDNTVQPKATS